MERDDAPARSNPLNPINPFNLVNPINLVYFFVSTPHATRGPPLTPDLGSPVIP